MYRCLSFLLLCSIWSCKNEKQQLESVLALKEMKQLPILEKVSSKILNAPDRSYFLRAEADLIATVNLDALEPEDITIEGKKVKLIIPKPTLSPISITASNLHLVYTKDHNDITLSKDDENAFLAQANQQFYADFTNTPLLSEAEANATQFLSSYLKALGYSTINIRFKEAH